MKKRFLQIGLVVLFAVLAIGVSLFGMHLGNESVAAESAAAETDDADSTADDAATDDSDTDNPSDGTDSSGSTDNPTDTTNDDGTKKPEKIVRKAQTVTEKSPKSGKVSYFASDLYRSPKTFTIKATAKTKITYIPLENAEKAGIKVTKKGKVTIPQGTKKGTYRIKVKAVSTEKYKPAKKVVKIVVKQHVVVIDPGHQRYADTSLEPNGPGSSTMKARVTGGTHGTTTGVPEYVLTLKIGKKLRKELKTRGYKVYMTRTSHDVNISNKERAEYATAVGGEIAVRLHADGASSSSASGASGLVSSAANPYVSRLAGASSLLATDILNAYCSRTGFRNRGVVTSDTMTGINWSSVPVMILEMGFMTNPSDDTRMQNADVQTQMVLGIADGIDLYFQ